MNRRQFLAGLGTGLVGMATAPALLAEGQCSRPMTYPNGYSLRQCSVGIPSHLMRFVAARQQNSQWCWAACIQMVFRVYGYDLPQEQLVAQTWGRLVNMPAYPGQIMQALNRSYIGRSGRRFRASGDVLSVNVNTAIADLSNRSPLIVGALGHATVLTGLSYTESNIGERQVSSAIVRDPWPGKPSRRTLSPEEWANINFAARVRCFSA
ncbi:papain-like cysteine protease family protein [Marinobacter mobilis]|uniref:papain-like cysteine protease family protein n=1 Tax=Marinobacter mobilis TaxID=488533 RepID=UPI0035C75AD0